MDRNAVRRRIQICYIDQIASFQRRSDYRLGLLSCLSFAYSTDRHLGAALINRIPSLGRTSASTGMNRGKVSHLALERKFSDEEDFRTRGQVGQRRTSFL